MKCLLTKWPLLVPPDIGLLALAALTLASAAARASDGRLCLDQVRAIVADWTVPAKVLKF